jgi:hypothetical protein
MERMAEREKRSLPQGSPRLQKTANQQNEKRGK